MIVASLEARGLWSKSLKGHTVFLPPDPILYFALLTIDMSSFEEIKANKKSEKVHRLWHTHLLVQGLRVMGDTLLCWLGALSPVNTHLCAFVWKTQLCGL